MANHPSDFGAAAGGPDEGVTRVPGEQARHPEPQGQGGDPATATAHVPAPGGWQGRAGGGPENVAPAPWSGGWPAPRPEDAWTASGSGGFGGWAPARPEDGRMGQPGPAPWYGAPDPRSAEHPPAGPTHLYPVPHNPAFGPPPPGAYYP